MTIPSQGTCVASTLLDERQPLRSRTDILVDGVYPAILSGMIRRYSPSIRISLMPPYNPQQWSESFRLHLALFAHSIRPPISPVPNRCERNVRNMPSSAQGAGHRILYTSVTQASVMTLYNCIALTIPLDARRAGFINHVVGVSPHTKCDRIVDGRRR